MKLTILHADVDYTLKLNDFVAAYKEFDFSTEPLLVGFHKPLKCIYAELETSDLPDQLSVQYWNGSAFVAMAGVEDGTEGFNHSGPIKFPLVPQVKCDLDGSGVEKYWLKIIPSALPAAVNIAGINLVLSNDKDFGFVPNILEYLPEGMTSWIGFHQEARDMIVQAVRNSGKKIITDNTLLAREVDQFDLLSIEEFRNASKYLALHLIFDFLSKSDEDAYAIKSKRFYERYVDALNSNLMTVDTNDNGVVDEQENLAVQFIGIRRE